MIEKVHAGSMDGDMLRDFICLGQIAGLLKFLSLDAQLAAGT